MKVRIVTTVFCFVFLPLCRLAYDTLMDPVKRQAYDSTLPFDDSIPSIDQEGLFGCFYVFQHNLVFFLFCRRFFSYLSTSVFSQCKVKKNTIIVYFVIYINNDEYVDGLPFNLFRILVCLLFVCL